MPALLKLLGNARAFLKALPAGPQRVHFALGNESCDLDSCIGALAMGVLISRRHPDRVVVPVMNVTRENFALRTENCFVLTQAEVPLDGLIFRDELDMDFILSKYPVSVSLVDHHILAKEDQKLAPYVEEIFDHRPVDTSYSWDARKVTICIESVGSCCTLIANCLLQARNCSDLGRPLAYLLYQVIVYDTIALKPQNHKATALDIEVAAKLETLYGFNEDHQELFDGLWRAHMDVSHLTPSQLLLKDLKLVEGVYIPGLPMLVEEFLGLEGSQEALADFAKLKQISALLLVGMSTSGGSVQRDLAVYSSPPKEPLAEALLKTLLSKQADFFLEEKPSKFGANIHLLHLHNVQVSRKQLVPLVKEAWNDYTKRQ
ncbi:exopolyphosphatase PRUNE1 [Dendroctonus ponderosae]|uniref:exopolyphosphatase PRUNE1 n=1 Tax=Dendroctonus ponderosae TaxID=77166 RepID=UPI002034D2FC|nr:exopolyphosphatase PRUNE1 [Dendroctonus ponderosae]